MIFGRFDEDVPVIDLPIGPQSLQAVVDTGFNGYLELPVSLFGDLEPEFEGELVAELAGGQTVTEEVYRVKVPFDGQMIDAVVSFVEGEGALLGTKMLDSHRLTIDFPDRTVQIERVATP